MIDGAGFVENCVKIDFKHSSELRDVRHTGTECE